MAHLVFVCHGNICRSPIAERVARRAAKERGMELEVESFALADEEIGRPIDRRAQKVLQEAGYDFDGHSARRIAVEHLERADLVIAVEPYQVDQLKEMAPGANVALLNDFNPDLEPGTALIDPWYGDQEGFYDTLADVEAAMPAILDELS